MVLFAFEWKLICDHVRRIILTIPIDLCLGDAAKVYRRIVGDHNIVIAA